MGKNHLLAVASTGVALCVGSASAYAANGSQVPGYSPAALGMGGAGIANPMDSMAAVNNPASMGAVGNRADIVATEMMVGIQTEINGREYSDAPTATMPLLGVNYQYNESITFGISSYLQGFSANYHTPIPEISGPFGTSPVKSAFGAATLLPTATYQFAPGHYIGVSAKISYTSLEVGGADVFNIISGGRFDGSAFDWGMGGGFAVGYLGTIAPNLRLGLTYSSPTWFQKLNEFAALLPDGGNVNLPQQAGVGLAYDFNPQLTFAFDYVWINWSGTQSFGNATAVKIPFGQKDGPGFGWNDQHVFRFGANYKINDQIQVRAGFSHSNHAMSSNELFLSTLAPTYATDTVTVGFTYKINSEWDIVGAFAHDFYQEVSGRDLGTGYNVKVGNDINYVSIGFGRKF